MSEIVNRFEKICAQYPDRTAVVYRNGSRVRRSSFSMLNDDVHRMAAYLKKCGVKENDRILAFAASSYRLCVFMLAALETGAAMMYVDITARQASLRSVFEQYRPDMVLVSDQTRYLRFMFSEIRKIKHIINVDRYAECEPDSSASAEISEETTGLLTMTTGSTGTPKTAVRSHRDLMNQLKLISSNISAGEEETILTTSFIYVFANILSGFTTVIPQVSPGRNSPAKLNRLLGLFSEEHITMIIGTPDFCMKAENIFPELRTLYFGGAILNRHEAEQIRRKFSSCKCRIIYGSTECSIIASVDMDEYISVLADTQRSLLGTPVEGVRVRLAEDGEIVVTADALLKKYLVNPDDGKERDEDGTVWHHTGDMAEYDGETLVFLGKKGRFININGSKVYSNCIEQRIISLCPSIEKCAVLQKNDRVYAVIQGPYCEKEHNHVRDVLKDFGTEEPYIVNWKRIPCDVKHHTKIDYRKTAGRLGL